MFLKTPTRCGWLHHPDPAAVSQTASIQFRTFATPAFGDFSGPVVSVLDGDTIDVLHNHRAERIRLDGIDCPREGTSLPEEGEASRLSPELWQGSHASTLRQGQVRTDHCRRASVRCHQCQPHVGRVRLVLVVQKIYARTNQPHLAPCRESPGLWFLVG